MFKFTRTGMNVIRIIFLTTIIFLIQVCIYKYIGDVREKVDSEALNNSMPIVKEKEDDSKENDFKDEETKEQVVKTNKNDNIDEKESTSQGIWQIKIEKISLVANIEEGITKEILNRNIGHFEETKKEKGNIGLAGHNRGYAVNYFEKLKKLQEGDEIQYTHNHYKKIYEVKKNIIIKDTDWKYLEDTEENMLTLITCVENEPNYRRCVQAVEKEEEESIEENNKISINNIINHYSEFYNVCKYCTSSESTSTSLYKR